MKKRISYNYEWWTDDGDIQDKHQSALEEHAEDHIKEMVKEGYTSGQLLANVRVDDSDGEDGIEYQGAWSRDTETL